MFMPRAADKEPAFGATPTSSTISVAADETELLSSFIFHLFNSKPECVM
jgi:hypothetical protein